MAAAKESAFPLPGTCIHLSAVFLVVFAVLVSLPAEAQAKDELASVGRSAADSVPEFHDLFARWRATDSARSAPVIVNVLTERTWVAGESRYAISTRYPAIRTPFPYGLPVAAWAITSGFGWREHPILGGWRQHSGIDLAAPIGSPVIAPSDGVVSEAGWSGGYGLMVQLEHSGGLETRYGHMSRLGVLPGQYVRRGQVIGYVGSTGLSTGPHLHYEVRVRGLAVNPVLGSPR